MGATQAMKRDALEVDVSTHAPVMGATARTANVLERVNVSTHAPVMGATFCVPSGATSM
jgi:hypothetical protein